MTRIGMTEDRLRNVDMTRLDRGPRGPKEHQAAATAGLWGLAESTLFFVVPDVYLSWVALSRPSRALRACLWAVAGAVLGGGVMYLWAAADPASAGAALEAVPAISPEAVAAVGADLQERSWWALVYGPLTGTPYKIYAAQAGALGMDLGALLVVSVPARLLRFALVTMIAAGLAGAPGIRRLSPAVLYTLHAVLWIAFYAAYWQAKGW